ncbi:hypothetical protein VTN00DRAFT_8977 [Thermoascus crustaceus]|uniref:uncharacterized protein n=1 Tax=Thermoascus crustaceus TaxID=5088 RepID=UPI0037435DCB
MGISWGALLALGAVWDADMAMASSLCPYQPAPSDGSFMYIRCSAAPLSDADGCASVSRPAHPSLRFGCPSPFLVWLTASKHDAVKGQWHAPAVLSAGSVGNAQGQPGAGAEQATRLQNNQTKSASRDATVKSGEVLAKETQETRQQHHTGTAGKRVQLMEVCRAHGTNQIFKRGRGPWMAKGPKTRGERNLVDYNPSVLLFGPKLAARGRSVRRKKEAWALGTCNGDESKQGISQEPIEDDNKALWIEERDNLAT